MTMHYDVIIIGTAQAEEPWLGSSPDGQEDSDPRTRRLRPARKGQLEFTRRGDQLQVHTKEEWCDSKGKPLHPHTNYYVGGNTKFYGAALFRLRDKDFCELRHHGGVSPAWPISYSDLEPYYTEAERLYHVHGSRGEDPTDPWASAPYPHPA